MTKKKLYKYRANVRQYVDSYSNYGHKLNDDDKEYLIAFENEYYSNGLTKDGSIHREALSEDEFKVAKKETFDATNSQNRDLYGISATSRNYLKFIDDDNNFVEPEDVKTSGISKIEDPQYAFNVFLEQTIDEIQSESSRDLKTILIEFGKESVKLGASLKPDKVNTAIKRAKAKKENSDAQ